MLETAPSFSIYSNNKEDDGEKDVNLTDKVLFEGSGDFSFVKTSMNLIKEEEEEILNDEIVDPPPPPPPPPSSPPMYLATGFGTNDNNNNAHHDFGDIMGNGISEEYCRELLDEYPNHAVLLRKYAELLQEKGHLQGAEEYYFRAAQADPGDGEVLTQYAQLVWELHHDHDKALTYFDLAAQTAPDNSIVMAAYAKFLWETEVNGEDQSAPPDSAQDNQQTSVVLHPIDVNDADTDDFESYYGRTIDENPSHPIFLKKYAQFLYQSKGDLQGAEEYYLCAIAAEPQDGKMLSQYATLLWELYHNQDQTLQYLERAIEAAPEDSDVLAAFARILWTIDDE